MQLLFDSSEEGERPGFGWIPGRVERFTFESTAQRLKVPHMGWNVVESLGSPLLEGLGEEPRFYFVHSFFAHCEHAEHSVGTTEYGGQFTSVVQNGNVYGCQFHPEKSHRFGTQLFSNFLELVNAAG